LPNLFCSLCDDRKKIAMVVGRQCAIAAQLMVARWRAGGKRGASLWRGGFLGAR
jgi:hypothetical protein